MPDKNVPMDPFQRGAKGFDLLGSLSMIVGRIASVPLQATILSTPLVIPLLRYSGISHHPAVLPTLLGLRLPALFVIPYPRLMLAGLSGLNALYQAYWGWAISLEPISLQTSLQISTVNMVIDSVLSILYLSRYTSSAATDAEVLTPAMLIGFGLSVTGTAIEFVSEGQRRRFKQDPSNKGKLYTGGLFQLARHINYTGFILSRAGQCMLASGWTAGAVCASISCWDLGLRAADILDEYCGKKVSSLGVKLFVANQRVVRQTMDGLQANSVVKDYSGNLLSAWNIHMHTRLCLA